jgi:Glycosyltransferase family 87
VRYPSLRLLPDILFLVCCVALTAYVLTPEIFGNGKGKDYPLWYWAGQQVIQGGDLYRRMTNGTLDFIYLPFAAALFAIPGYFGKIPLYLTLCLLNAGAWWITGQLSNAMTGSDQRPSPWLAALPGIITLPFVYDQFDLGQPNLILLALMLIGFWMLKDRPWMAGFMFGLATAIKVFPVAVFPYLLWRRRWASAASMIVFLGIFLFVLPAPVRGFQRNVDEVATWYHGMVGSSSEQGFGQRDQQNWSWVNQSIIAVGNRLLRPVNFDQDNASAPPRYINILDLDFKTTNLIVLGFLFMLGLGFIAACRGSHI